jgi:ABC-type polysaccharide/polyol phosphate transport system ATPase subunit
VHGRIGSLLSIESGLMPLLTGRENAMLLGVLAGLPKQQVRDALDEIKHRTGLEQAFERPVSTYSQGMRARLGFAVVEQANPDILLLDEVHEAIDEAARVRLERRVRDILTRGGAVMAAGHDRAMLMRLCDSALLVEHGSVRRFDHFDENAPRVAAGAAV